jgi:hypothetical protein
MYIHLLTVTGVLLCMKFLFYLFNINLCVLNIHVLD